MGENVKNIILFYFTYMERFYDFTTVLLRVFIDYVEVFILIEAQLTRFTALVVIAQPQRPGTQSQVRGASQQLGI